MPYYAKVQDFAELEHFISYPSGAALCADEPPSRKIASVPDAKPRPVCTYLGTPDICQDAKATTDGGAVSTERLSTLGEHPRRILSQHTGGTPNAGRSPTGRKPNTFVRPAELAHMGKRSCAAAAKPAAHRTAGYPRHFLQQWDVAHVS